MNFNDAGKISISLVLIISLVFGIFIYSDSKKIISFAQEATSTPEAATSTLETASSTPQTVSSTLAAETMKLTFSEKSTSSEQSANELTINEEGSSEEEIQAEQEQVPPVEQFEPAPPPLPPQPPLKERKFEKPVHFDKNPSHSCAAKNFSINLSGRDRDIVEIELTGTRRDSENLEIGGLPLGIDITFLNNGDYSWSPAKSDRVTVLHIVNQEGSQKGNFSVPIIYTSSNSTTVCQINVINF